VQNIEHHTDNWTAEWLQRCGRKVMDRLPYTLARQQRCRPLYGAWSTVKKT